MRIKEAFLVACYFCQPLWAMPRRQSAIQEISFRSLSKQTPWREKINHLLRRVISGMTVCVWLLLGASGPANASSTPIFEYVDTIIGPWDEVSTSFTIAAPGTYVAKLTDLTFFPNSSFGDVALGIMTSSQVFGSTSLNTPNVNDSDSFMFTATPGTYLSYVLATCTGLCTYGVEITAVPVPAAVLLFGSGLIGLVMVGRRRSNVR